MRRLSVCTQGNKMEYLKSGFKSVLGNQGGQTQPSALETVERLCDRVASSTLLEDRRDAVRALKSLSKKFRLEVGTQAMDLLINVLHTDRNDTEITGLALDAMCNILSADPSSQPVEEASNKNGQTLSDAELGVQFTEIFIKKPENVTLLLGLLEEYEFHVRWPTVKLLTILLTNRSYQLQQCILVSPLGVSRLMDLLSDSREIIRNEGLLLLIQLTKSNAAIQKIVAFENAFDRLLEIIAEEGYSDGGIVVEDCLLLMQNLLRSNVSNQNFFREGSYIQRLTSFFEFTPAPGTGEGEAGWLPQKITNIQFMLQLVRILVSPDNPQQSTASCQKVMNQCGVLRQLCDILMASGIPADILTETINTVSEVIRGHPANQEYFAQVNAPSSPPRPAIFVLLMSMINDQQPHPLRCAVLYCFQCYLYKNQQGQSMIVSTLLPSSADDATSVSAGQLLCSGLFSPDPLANWCAAVALSHCLKGNPTQKEQLLRVQLATSVGNPPVSLLQQCTNMLSQGGRIQTQVGLLLLLCSWLSDCAIAVAHILHSAANVPYFTSQIEAHGEEAERLVGSLCSLLLGICYAYNDNSVETCKKQDLRLLISKRIGVDNLLDKISYISKSEHFQRAVKSPEIKVESAEHVLFDHEFTKLFKKLEAAVTRAVEETPGEQVVSTNHVNGKMKQDLENHESIVASYKELIREQDEKLGKLKSKYADLESSHNQAQAQLVHQAQEIQKFQDQVVLSKTFQPPPQQSTASLFGDSPQNSTTPKENSTAALFANTPNTASFFETDSSNEVAQLKSQVTELQRTQQAAEQNVQEKEEQIKRLKNDLEISQASLAVATAAATLGEHSTAGHDHEPSDFTREQYDEMDRLRSAVNSLQMNLHRVTLQNTTLQNELNACKLGTTPVSGEDLVDQIRNLEEKLSRVTEERDTTVREHEDLLIMLTDQDAKLKSYKQLLKAAGQEVSDDEEEDEEEGEEDDEDDEDENEGEREEKEPEVKKEPQGEGEGEEVEDEERKGAVCEDTHPHEEPEPWQEQQDESRYSGDLLT